MALASLGPFNLPPQFAAGYTFTIIPAGQFSGPNIAGQVLLTNVSGYIIELFSSSQGQLPNLNPGEVTAVAVPKGGGSLIGVIMGGSATVASPTVTAQFGTDGETFQGDSATFPGSYPFSVPLVGGTVAQITVPMPTIGTDWSYVLPSNQRLQLVQVALLTSGASSRYPFLVLNNGVTNLWVGEMASSAITGLATTPFYGSASSVAAPINLVNGSGWNFFFPNVLLPAGSVILSVTTNLQPTDQWELVQLSFSTN